MKFKAYAAIDHICQSTSINHAQVVLVLEALDLETSNTLCHRSVLHIHRVVQPWNKLG